MPSGKSVFEMAIRVSDQGKSVLTNLQNELRQTANAGGASASTWTSKLMGVGAAIGAAVAGVWAMKHALSTLVETERIENVRIAFAALHKDAVKIKDAIGAGFAGTVADYDLEKMALRVKAAGASLDQVRRLSEVAFQASVASGTPAVEVWNKFASAVVSGRSKSLAMLGVQVDLKKAVSEYADALGVKARSLDKATQNQITLNAIIEAGARAFRDLPMDKVRTDAQKLTTVLGDLAEKANMWLGRNLIDQAKGVAALGEAFKDAITHPLGRVSEEEAFAAAAMRDYNEAMRAGAVELDRLAALKEKDRVAEERRVALEREASTIFDEKGRKIGDRLRTEEAFRAAVDELFALEARRREGLWLLNAAEEAHRKQLELKVADYRALHGVALPFVAAVTAALERQAPTADDMVTRYNRLIELMRTDTAGKSADDLRKIADEGDKLVGVLDNVAEGFQDTAEVMDTTRDLYASWKERILAVAGARERETKWAAQAADAEKKASDELATLWAIGADPTPAERVRKTYEAIRDLGRTPARVAELAAAFAALYQTIKDPDAAARGQGAALALAKRAEDERKRLDAERKGGARARVEDITKEELAARLAVVAERDALNKKLAEIELERLRVEEEFAKDKRRVRLHEAQQAELDARREEAIEEDALKRRERARAAADKIARDQDRVDRERQRERDRLEREMEKARDERWRAEDVERNSRLTALQADLAAVGAAGSEVSERMAGAMAPAQLALDAFVDASRASGETSQKAIVTGISAMGAATAATIKNVKARSIVRGLFEEAAAFGALATGDVLGFGWHQLSASMFFAIAGHSGSGKKHAGTAAAAARNYEAPGPSQLGAGSRSEVYNFNMAGFGVYRNEREMAVAMGQVMNLGRGLVKLHGDLIGKPGGP